MKFLDDDGDRSPKSVRERHDRYMEYLSTNRHLLPDRTNEFAIAEWHYNPEDHRCPHDSWLEILEVKEIPLSDDKQSRQTEIRILLLGAYHDGYLEIIYKGVQGYKLDLLPVGDPPRFHGDWLIDEIRLSETNSVIHEIKFWRNATWQIECEDIEHRWIPS